MFKSAPSSGVQGVARGSEHGRIDRAVSYAVEAMEARLLMSVGARGATGEWAVELQSGARADGARRPVGDRPAGAQAGQVFFLSMAGTQDVDYHGPLTVRGVDVPAFVAPDGLKGQERNIVGAMLGSLTAAFPEGRFTTRRPSGVEYSTIYLGGDGARFADWGRFYGLAEKVDGGNKDHGDDALVFSDAIAAPGMSAAEYGSALAAVVAHEAGHLTGAAHGDEPGFAGEAAGPLAAVAFDPKIHVAVGQDVVADVLADGKVTIAGRAYAVHPKIVAALQNYLPFFNAGCVGPDGFPDVLMGQNVIHAMDNGAWVQRVLDMAWSAQDDASFTAAEKSQILAYSYGFLTHSTGDHFAHTLANEFTEGIAPGFAAAGSSLTSDQRDLGNMVRHFMVEGYVADALPGYDSNPARTVLPDGDVSDDSTPGIAFDAPVRFIYETLIRAFPDDPTAIAEMKWETGTLVATAANKSFVRAAGSFLDDGFKVGQRITVNGFSGAGNNGAFHVTAVTATAITVAEALVQETASGNEQILVRVPKTAVTTIGVNAANNTFTRTAGSFVDDGFTPGQRFAAFGFNNNAGDFIVKSVTPTALEIVGKFAAGDAAGNGNEQLAVQGKRGPILDELFKLRDFVYTKAAELGDRGPSGGLGGQVSDLIDKVIRGQSISDNVLNDVFKNYLYNWSDAIDEGVRNWGKVGLAFTKAMYDPQRRRDIQNRVAASKGADTLSNTERAQAENIGILKVVLDVFDDPNGDGSKTDSLFVNYLLPMIGLPEELGVLRNALGVLGGRVDAIRAQAPQSTPFNPVGDAAKPADVQAYNTGIIKDLFTKRFGVDPDIYDYVRSLGAKMDMKSLGVGGFTLSIFKPGDHAKVDAYMGMPANHHEAVAAGFDNFPGVTYYPNPSGVLKDDGEFNKTTFAAYADSVTLTKMMMLMETPTDANAAAAGQLSALYTDLTGSAYDFKKLNLNGAHGGNVLTATLPGVGGTASWLTSIDADQVWRADSYTTTSALYRVSTQKTAASPATWKATVPNGTYKVYASWAANVTTDFDNLTNSDFPDQKLSPATNATYTVFNNLTSLGTAAKDQRTFSGDTQEGGIGYALLGTYTITNGVIRVQLSNVADGHVVAGPVLLEAVAGGARTVVQNLRDAQTLAQLPPADDYVDSPASWADLSYATGGGNNPLWESARLRPAFRTLFKDWLNGAQQFPDLGDATSPDPNAVAIAKTQRPTSATPFGAAVADMQLAIPIPTSLRDAIFTGLDKVVGLMQSIEETAPFKVTLPGLDKSLKQLLDLSGNMDRGLRKPIKDYFAADLTPTFGELFNVIKGTGAGGIGGRLDNLNALVEFDVDLRKAFSVDNLKLSLGAAAANVGLSVDGTLSAAAVVKFVDGLVGDLPKLTFGVDMTPGSGAALADRVYVKVDKAILSADIHASGLNLGAKFGFFEVGVVGGNVDLTAGATLTFNDPNADGRITLGEIAGTSLASLVNVQAVGTLAGSLPIKLQSGLNVVGNGAVGTVAFGASDVFNLDTFAVNFNGDFSAFASVTPTSMLGLLKQVGAFLEQFAKSSAMGVKLPFSSKTIGDVLDLRKAFQDKVLVFLEPQPGQTAFDSAQQLAVKLAAALGLPTSAIAAKFDALAKELTFHVKLTSGFGPTVLPVDLGLSLGSLAGLSTSSTLNVSGNAGVEFTFGVNLAAPSTTVTAENDAVANGRLTGAAHFAVKVGGDDAVDVTVPADANNNTLDDLIADINVALAAAGLGNTVQAGRNGSKVTFATKGLLTPAALTVTAAAGDPAITQLGLAASQSASDSLGSRFFIKDASLTGAANLAATDIDATATLGFLKVGVLNGTGGVTANFSAALTDPGTEAADGRISLGEIFAALAGDVSTLAPAPRLSGSANLTLPLKVEPNVLGAEHPAAPAASVAWTDITNPDTLSVAFNADTNKLLDFKQVTYAGIVQAILQAVEYVGTLEKFSFLNQKLPLLNKSVSDLVGAATALLEKVRAVKQDVAGLTLQDVEAQLEQALGFSPAALTLTPVGKTVKVGLNFNAGGTQDIPIDLDLATLAGNVPGLAGAANLLDVGGTAKLTVGANAAINIQVGVDLTNPLSPRPFLYDTSSINLDAKAIGTNLNFTAALGPIGLFVKNGTVNLDRDGNPNTADSATFTAGIFDDNGDGRHYFDELGTDDVRMTLVGQAKASLPLFFPTSSQSLGTLSLAITNLADISHTTTITTPDIAAQFNAVDLFSNVGAIVDGLDLLLGKLQAGMDGQVFGRKLPLIGTNLKGAARFIEDIRTQAVEPLRDALSDTPPAQALKDQLFTLLGPAGVGVLGDLDKDGDIDLDDIGVTLGNGGNQILFKTRLRQAAAELDVPLGFDIGLPGLGLEVNGGVAVKVGFDFQFSFGISRADGFFFVTDARDDGGALTPELKVDLDASIPGLSATGRLAILQLQAKDDPAHPSHFTGSFSVDLLDPNGDGKLTIAELGSGAPLSSLVKAKLTANADVHLKLAASFGGSANFPSINTDFALAWAFSNAATDATDAAFGGRPTIKFENIQLSAGDFFGKFAKSILGNVQKVLKPIQPVIDILTAPLPVLSDIKPARDVLDRDKDGSVTLLDLVKLFNPNSKLDFITALAKTADLINAVPTGLGNLMIDLGHFDIGSDLRTDTQLTDTDLSNVLQVNTSAQLAGAAQSFMTKLKELDDLPDGGIAFPLIQSPASVFKLLIGQDVNLFTYDMPALKANFEMSKFFPILGPLGARFTGSIGAIADFAFGYDTSGLREFFGQPEGARDVATLLNGLYVSDRKNADGTGAEVPEVTLTGGIEAAGEINLGIASAGVSGGIFANVRFDLDDPNDDGKMRLNEIVAQFERSPLCVFDVSGEITAGLSAYVKFLFSKKTFNIATIKLLDFSFSCPVDAAEPDPILATVQAGGVLRLNVGADAASRLYGDLADIDEVFVVSPGSTASSVFVESMGFKQEYFGVGRIVADGGTGNDSIVIKDGVFATASLSGGDGDDSLFGGSGDATLVGGIGNDQLRGGTANDSIAGGDGDDTLLGQAGNDKIDGGIGDDVGEGGDGNDTLTGGAGADAMSGGAGDDNLDGGADADDLSGDDGADVLAGGLGNDALDGGVGNDNLSGGDGVDMITAGAGNDTASGGLADDSVDGGTGNDSIDGDAGNDTLVGGTGADTIGGGDGADQITGNAGADSITGGIGSDVIDAGTESDFIDAGDGDDTVTGGAGSETIIGGAGADLIYAGTGETGGGTAADTHLIYADVSASGSGFIDRIFGDAGADTIFAGGGADTVSALAGDDVIDAADGDDVVTAGAGNDTVGGGAGDDSISGQEGDDAISGDDGGDSLAGDAGRDLIWGGVAVYTRAAFAAGGFGADGITPLVVAGLSVPGLISDGRDSITGGIGGDWLFGGGEADQIFAGEGDDYVDGGAGNDTALGDAGVDVVRGGLNDDLLRGGAGIDQVYGEDGDDQLYGDAGDAAGSQAGQRLWGGAGADVLYAYAASSLAAEYALTGDEMHGGADNDLLYGNLRRDSLYGDGGADLLQGDRLAGSVYGVNASAALAGGGDQLFGGAGEDFIFGGGGADVAYGGGDSDRIEGQDGTDSLYGGTGIDVIVLDVDAAYTAGNDSFDGHRGNEAAGDAADDNATDILLIPGTDLGDTIVVGETGGQLRVTYNGRVIPATWRGAGGPLVEQFRVSGLGGNDRIEFLSGGATGLDLSALAARSNDWVGVIDGGSGDDTLIGTPGRDRIDGGRGSDSLLGMAGDDRLLGDAGAGAGDAQDLDRLFGGQGNDDQVGGQGRNFLYAWSRDPAVGTKFGIFVDSTGGLHDDDGGGLFKPEDTGMNRMLGGALADKLYGGTGLDFLYGNGGQDELFNRDGTPFETLEGGVAGQEWKDYARSTGKVWYVGASNVADIITVDFVTEPGALAGHHLVTRLTNNNGNFTFAAQVQLDFAAKDENGRTIWDPNDLVFDPDALAFGDSSAFAGLLPPEGDFQAIIIDALGGNDQITVGPTVLKSVWVDAGAGDDRVTIKSGNPILTDAVEGATRNDTRATAYNLFADPRVGAIAANRVLTGMTLDNPGDVDWYRLRLAQAVNGNLVVTGLSAADGLTFDLFNGTTLLGTSVNGAFGLSGVPAGVDLFLKVSSNQVPTIYQLAFAAGANPVAVPLSTRGQILRRDIIIGGSGDDVLSGGSGEDWVLGGIGNDVLSGGLDRQASDLLFGEAGDDTFQVIPDALPLIPGSDRTILPTLNDSYDGGAGNDRVLFLGGDLDRNNRAVPDHVAIRYNALLHTYELTALVWDVANQRFDTAGGVPRQLFAFYRPRLVERTVIDTRAGDDEVHADPGYLLGGSTWGIKSGDFQQNATIAALTIIGGDGSDRLFGGALGDVIDGGAGLDFISGGAGNDTITGGADNDVLAGNSGVPRDRFESVTRGGVAGRNDDPTFAADLGAVVPGQVISGLTLNLGDAADWYAFKTPDALLRLGTSQAAFLTADQVDVRWANGDPAQYYLYAARLADPADPTSIVPVERPTGVPAFYMIRVLNPNGGATPAEVAGTYSVTFKSTIGKTVHVPGTAAVFTLNSVRPTDQPAIIPLGDINGDGFVDFIGAVQDYVGSAADDHSPIGVNDYGGNQGDLLKPSFARVFFGSASTVNATLQVSGVSLRLPAPVGAPSYFLTQSIFANPGDYNGDGIKDIAVAVTRTNQYSGTENPSALEGVYIIFGRAGGFTGTIDVVADADVTIRGFAQPAVTTGAGDFRLSVAAGDVTGDGIDDLLVGNSVANVARGATYLFKGRTNWSTVVDKTVYSVDFNDAGGAPSADGFTIDNTNPASGSFPGLWHVSTGRNAQAGHSAGGSLYFGQNEGSAGGGTYSPPFSTRAGRVTSTPISLAALGSAKLSFKYVLATTPLPPNYDSSSLQDLARVMISKNGGAFVPLQQLDGATLRDAGAANRVLAGNRAQPGLLTDPTTGWTTATFDLSAYVGSSVQIRFDFNADATAATGDEGWYVDDVVVEGAVLSPASADATFSGTANGDRVGSGVAGIGDFNGDGKKDFAILRSGPLVQGEAYILYGRGAGGPAFTSTTVATLATGTNGVTLRSSAALGNFGVRAAGDIDHDGFADLLLTPSSDEAQFVPSNFGPPKSYVVFGRAGLTSPQTLSTMAGVLTTARAGGFIALGDVNGDGFDDLGANSVLGRPTLDVTGNGAMAQHTVGEIFLGRAAARTALSLDTPDLVVEPGKPNYDLVGFRPNTFNSPGDLNKDGRADWVLADAFGGFSRIFLGQALQAAQSSGGGGGGTAQPVEEHQLPLANPTAGTGASGPTGVNLATAGPTPALGDAHEVHGAQAGERLSAPRAGGDLNGDGVADLIVGGAIHDYVIMGPANLTGRVDVASRAGVVFTHTDFLAPAQRMGDVTGDGVDDLIYVYSKPRAADPALYDVTIAVITGGSTIPRNPTLANATYNVTFVNGFRFDGGTPFDLRTFTVAALKFDEDANADILIVARGAGEQAGYMISGAAIKADANADLRIGTAGETVMVTFPRDTTTRTDVQTATFGPRFGGYDGVSANQDLSAVVPGDVNGDGFEDFLIADKGFATDHIVAPIGRAYVLLGRPNAKLKSNIFPTPTFALPSFNYIYQGVDFGASAIAVGDVNGDGYADYAVGRSREGGANAPFSLNIYNGSLPPLNFLGGFTTGPVQNADTAAAQFLSRKSGDASIGRIEADLESSVYLEGQTWATTGDYNGDGKLDLAVGEPARTVRDTQGTLLDRQERGQVYIFYSIKDEPRGLSLTMADQVISGEGEFDKFGLLSPTGPIDLNGDRRADLLIGASGADVLAPTLIPTGGKTYVIYGATGRLAVPTGATVGSLSNQTITGDGDFLVDPGTGQPIVLRDPDANNDGVPDTLNYVLPAGQAERWYRFHTVGDGKADDAIRLSNPARDRATTAVRGVDGGLVPAAGVPGFTAQPSAATFQIGGASGKVGVFEFDVSYLLPLLGKAGALEQVQLQLDYSNATFAAGQSLRVFVGQLSGDGFVSPADGAAAATLAGERAFTAADTAAGVIQIDVTAAVRAALLAGRTRMMLRVVGSAPQVSLDVQRSTNAGRQTQLTVTAARQQGVLGDLVDPAGNVLARGLSVISLRTLPAGEYFLRVYNPFGAGAQTLPFTIDMTVPQVIDAYADGDRDEIAGGDGDDTITGNGGIDRLNGQSGNDSFVGDGVEVLDGQGTEPATQAPATGQESNVPIATPDVVVAIPDPALRAVIADALGIGYAPGTLNLTRPILASELAQIRDLNAADRGISDLTGLEQLINLESLDLSGNRLTRVSSADGLGFPRGLVGLTRLRTLNLDGNLIRNLAPLAALTGLTSLSVDGMGSALSPASSPVRNTDTLARFTGTLSPANAVGWAVGRVGRNVFVTDPADDTTGTNAGAVHLYDGSTGALLHTFYGVDADDQFGWTAVSVGKLLVVGAPYAASQNSANSGNVYVYDSTTFELVSTLVSGLLVNNARYGWSLAAYRNGVFVGAPTCPSPFVANQAMGTVAYYSFDPAAPVVFGFGPPTPTDGDLFGQSITVSGDRVYIGAPGRDVNSVANVGVVYVGNPETAEFVNTLANPLPGAFSEFGSVLATVGGRVAVGVPTTASSAGVVHLFDGATGGFQRTVANPVPNGSSQQFGFSLAAYDDTTLLVGAPTPGILGTVFGRVHLIDASTGALVQTITNPSQATADAFGRSVAVLGGDILVGAPGISFGSSTGAAYLIKGPRVTDLAPLAGLTNLRTLSLANQRVSDLGPLAGLTNLERLYLNSNLITGGLAPLNNLTRLASLSLNGNPLDNAAHTQSVPALAGRIADFTYDANRAPTIAPIGPRATPANTQILVNITVADPDGGDPLYVTAVSDNTHVGVTVLNNGQLLLTPSPDGVPFTGVANITVTAFDGASGAQDGRGRSTTRTFALSVGLAAIGGAKFDDLDADGFRDPNEAGAAGWTMFLDADGDGVLDAGEASTVTDAEGNYAFNGLAPGNYTVAQVSRPEWVNTAPLRPVNANFTGGAAQGFTTSGGADPWHLTSRRPTDAGHSAGSSFYFGVEGTGTYANNSTGILSSPVIDLRGVNAPVRLDFNHRLTAIDTTSTPATADFNALDGSANADGYSITGPWHLSSGRRNQGGHSSQFSMYFGTGEGQNGGGQYSNGTSGNLTSSLINLSGLGGATITLNLNYLLSANGGALNATGPDLATITVINGATRTTIASNVLKGILGNTGTTFTALALDLSSFAGQQIQLEFRFVDTNDNVRGEGWYVDDVTVTARQNDVATVGVFANGVFTPLANNGLLNNLPDDTGGFVPVSLDLSSFSGQQIQIQYRFTADAGLTAEGWYVDDARVTIGSQTTLTLAAGQTAAGVDFGGLRAGITFSPGAVYSIAGQPGAPMLSVESGTVTITPAFQATLPNLGVTVAGGAGLVLNGTQRLSSLSLAAGATATLAPGQALTVDALSLAAAAKLDVGSGFLIVNYQPSLGVITGSQVGAMIASGRNGGAWTGPGITSAVAAGTSGRAVGYVDNNDGAGGAVRPTFGGQPVGANAILVRMTLGADADLDGAVDFNDLVKLAQNYNQPVGGWGNADFNFDGAVDFNDLVPLAQNYNQTLPAAGETPDPEAAPARAALPGVAAAPFAPASAAIVDAPAATSTPAPVAATAPTIPVAVPPPVPGPTAPAARPVSAASQTAAARPVKPSTKPTAVTKPMAAVPPPAATAIPPARRAPATFSAKPIAPKPVMAPATAKSAPSAVAPRVAAVAAAPGAAPATTTTTAPARTFAVGGRKATAKPVDDAGSALAAVPAVLPTARNPFGKVKARRDGDDALLA